MEKENRKYPDKYEYRLIRFLKKDPSHPLSQKDTDELWNRIQSGNKHQAQKRIFSRAMGIAASISLLIAAAWYLSLPPVPETNYLAILENHPQQPDSTKNVQLVLANNQKLSIDGEDAKVGYQEDGIVNVNSKTIEQTALENQAAQAFNQLIVPIGKRSTLTFADGTKVWVNSGTKVIYPVQFATDKREIFVDGEAFLEVSRDEAKPFIVKTRKMDVKVLGTQFNVSAYEKETEQQIVLVSGKVEVDVPGQDKNILAPNQKYSYNNETSKSSISKVDVNEYIAWKDGYYQFRQQPLDLILQKIARYYGKSIQCDEQTGSLTCSGKLDLKENLEEVLKTLQKVTPIEIEQQSGHISITRKY